MAHALDRLHDAGFVISAIPETLIFLEGQRQAGGEHGGEESERVRDSGHRRRELNLSLSFQKLEKI